MDNAASQLTDKILENWKDTVHLHVIMKISHKAGKMPDTLTFHDLKRQVPSILNNFDSYIGLPFDRRIELANMILEIVYENIPEKGKNIIIVDDSASLVSMLMDFLWYENYNVIAVADEGENAINILNRHVEKGVKIDAVIMDIMMPGLDGVGATEMIKQSYPDIKVVALTGFPSFFMKSVMKKAGADFFISKSSKAFNNIKKVLEE